MSLCICSRKRERRWHTEDGSFSSSSTVDESPKSPSTVDDVFSGANGFITKGEGKVGEALDEEELAKTSNFIYNLLLGIAIVIAVAIGIVIGIKMMMASATEKAEVKELLWPYVLGCIVVFGAIGIWKLAVTVFAGF